MQYCRSAWSCLRSVTLYAAMILLVSGCASSGGQKLVIDTREVPAVVYLPKEIKAMLEDMGYEVIPESDAKRWARKFNDYKMRKISALTWISGYSTSRPGFIFTILMKRHRVLQPYSVTTNSKSAWNGSSARIV